MKYNNPGDNMNKKNFLITMGVIVTIFVIVLTIFIVKEKNDVNDQEENKGQEYLMYSNYYILNLVKGDEPTYEILGLTSTGQNETSLTIPSTIDGYKVTKLLSLEKQFADYLKIKEITIGKYINYIGSRRDDSSLGTDVFECAENLTRIMVDSENETYSSLNGILYDKKREILIKYPSKLSINENGTFKLIDSVKEIYNKSFINNTIIEKIEINEALVKIGKSAFANCKNLKEIIFKNSMNLRSIEDEAFYGCNKLIEVNVPEGVLTIGNLAFAKCSALQSITLPKSLQINNCGNNICLITYQNDGFKIYCSESLIDEIKGNYQKFGIKTANEMNNIIRNK